MAQYTTTIPQDRETLKTSLVLPSDNLGKLKAKLDGLGKSAEKCGCKPPTFRVIAEKMTDEGNAYSEVEIEYQIIRRIGGWHFIASLETLDSVNGENRNRVAGFNLTPDEHARYILADQACEHCNARRARNKTFIIRSEGGDTKQIGSTCIGAYLGLNPESAIRSIMMADLINSMTEDEDLLRCSGARVPLNFHSQTIAEYALSVVSKNGWISRGQAMDRGVPSTSDTVKQVLCLTRYAPRSEDKAVLALFEPSEFMKTTAADCLERLKAKLIDTYCIRPEELDPFDYKVAMILNRGFGDMRDIGILAAAVCKEAERMVSESRQTTTKNEWHPSAVEGGKFVAKATVVTVKGLPGGQFGPVTLVKFVTEDGYPLITFYSGKDSFEVGKTVTVKGTVKRLDDGKYGKAVILTRCKTGP